MLSSRSRNSAAPSLCKPRRPMSIASIWLDGPLELGLEPVHLVLLALTVVVSTLTVAQGRAKALQGVVHLVLLASFVFLSIQP